MDFVDLFSKIGTTIYDVITSIFKLPSFIISSIGILPDDLQTPFLLVITILVILLIYRFIK